MAISTSPGYGNLSQGNYSPVIFSQKAIKAFRKASVVEAITNTDYFGEISAYGDVVTIMREPNIVITPYTRGSTNETQDLDDEDFTITVDQANKFQFAVEDVEKKHSHINFEDLAANKAAYEMKDAFDTHVLNFMATSAPTANRIGTTSVSVGINVGATPSTTTFTPLGILNRLKRLMDQNNIPADNRYFVADPVFYEALGDENSKLMAAYYTGDSESPLFNGLVADKPLRAFKLYESNNLPSGGSGSDSVYGSTNYGTILAGHMSGVATVNQITKTEMFRSPDRFADVTRGLHVFGRGVLREESIFAVRWSNRLA